MKLVDSLTVGVFVFIVVHFTSEELTMLAGKILRY